MTAAVFQSIALDDIRPCPTNPRREIEPAALAELVASVKEHGILQPVLVRPTGRASSIAAAYELVCGHRRFAAAREAGLAEIPATVRELADDEALELQLAENCRRVDIHFLDEADAYHRLHTEWGYTVEVIAAKVGKSPEHVARRLKLRALPPKARELALADKLPASLALIVARIPVPELAEAAAREVSRVNDGGDSPMSVKHALDHVEKNYMLRLKGAPFNTRDPELLPAAGSCTSCPKRTGAQRELFDDIKSPDVCTDVTCFGAKKIAHGAALLAKAKAEGRPVLSKSETKAVFQKPWRETADKAEIAHDAPFVALDAQEWVGNTRKTYREMLGANAPEVTLGVCPYTNQVVELVDRKALGAVLKAAGLRDKSSNVLTPAEKRKREQQRREAERNTARRRGLVAEFVRRVEFTSHLPRHQIEDLFRAFVRGMLRQQWYGTVDEICTRRGIERVKRADGGRKQSAEDALSSWLESASAEHVRGLAYELVLARLLSSLRSGDVEWWREGLPDPEQLEDGDTFDEYGSERIALEMMQALGVDVAEIVAGVDAVVEQQWAEEDAAAAKKKPAKKAKPAKASAPTKAPRDRKSAAAGDKAEVTESQSKPSRRQAKA